MKKITVFKMTLLAFVMIAGSLNLSAQLLVEDFSYTIGNPLNSGTGTTVAADATTSWAVHSAHGTNNITVTTPTISYTGYKSSSVGAEVTLTTTGEDINKAFTSQNSGSLYVAFLVNITSSQTTGDYPIHFSQSSGSTAANFYGKLWIKKDASSTNFAFGISKLSTTAANINYTGFNYVVGTTYLLVIKYTFVSGATNDLTDLFINPTPGGTEPTSPTISATDISSSADPTGLTAICLRQGSSSNAPALKLDGIRVATAWADAVATSTGPTPVATPIYSGTSGNVISSQLITITSATTGASIYYTIDGSDPNNTGNGTAYTAPVTISSTTTLKAIAYYTGMTASSIASATYTFPTEVANLAALRTSNQSGFYKVTGEVYATFKSVTGKVSYIQDFTSWSGTGAGIVVYDATGKITTNYNLGDGIKNIYCTLSMFNGTLELIPFNDPGTANSTGNTITPRTITIADLNTGNYQGQLVKINSATFTTVGTGVFVSGTAYTINDGATDGKLKAAYADVDYISSRSSIPGAVQDITGVVYNSSVSEVDLVPRTNADFSAGLNTDSRLSTLNSKIYSSNGNVVLSALAGETVQIYNAVGQKLVEKTTVGGENSIPVTAKGVVLVKVGNRLAKVIL